MEKVYCSNCGFSEKVVLGDMPALVKKGWGSYGRALYCPECTKTWDKRNPGRPMAGEINTLSVIMDMVLSNACEPEYGSAYEGEFDRVCQTCGAEIDVGWSYCPFCGQHVPPADYRGEDE